MSTDLQLKGDSRRRQLELSQTFAAEHDLELVDESQLEDIGVSAFKGANVRGGALGKFLDAVKANKIARGSYLLVESLDRLSRQEVRKSLSIFLGIIDAGINLVTLADRRIYTAEKADEIELITSLVIMSRAHEESRTKSQRVGAAWANKRANAKSRPLTSICPAWLTLSKDKTRYEVIARRVQIVRSIFEDSAAGMGNYSITRRLNQSRVPHFGRSRGWCTSYVSNITINRSVLGEFQPHQIVNGKRVPVGSTIPNYFPAIVDEDLFYRVQALRRQRKISGSGRKGLYVSNLFTRLATCAYCGSPMRFENKGYGPNGGTYLSCDNSRRGLGCERVGWRYEDFETSFLAFVHELDLETLVRSGDETNKRIEIEANIRTLEGQRVALQEARERTYELFLQAGTAADFVGSKLRECEQQLAAVNVAIAAREAERGKLSADARRFYDGKDEIKALIEQLKKRSGEENYKLRTQIAAKLQSLVTTLIVAPLGHLPMLQSTIKALEAESPAYLDVIDHLKSELSAENNRRRYFAAGFKDGSVRGVYPSHDDPLQFEEQLLGTPSGIFRLDPAGISSKVL
jgi:DNA invertase Pin-like site-specific DNA recombinase